MAMSHEHNDQSLGGVAGILRRNRFRCFDGAAVLARRMAGRLCSLGSQDGTTGTYQLLRHWISELRLLHDHTKLARHRDDIGPNYRRRSVVSNRRVDASRLLPVSMAQAATSTFPIAGHLRHSRCRRNSVVAHNIDHVTET